MNTNTLYCTFYVQDLFFGVDVRHVQEVLRAQPMTNVPLSDSVVRGLINLRGQILTALDMRRRLSLEERETSESMNIVVKTQNEAVSLLVDDIGDVLGLNASDMETPPPTVKSPLRELLQGVQKLDDTLLLILDLHQTIHATHSHSIA